MNNSISTIMRDPFFRHTIVFFAGSMVVSVLNYLYHPVLGRLLSIEKFGDTEALLSLLAQAGILLGIFSQIIINNVSHHRADPALHPNKQSSPLYDTLAELYSLAWMLIGPIALLLFIFNQQISAIFKLQSELSIIVLIVLIVLSVLSTFQMAILQGQKLFTANSISSILQAGGKLLFAVLLVLLGFGVPGAIMGLVLAQIVSIIYTYPKTRQHLALLHFKRPTLRTLKKEIPFGFLIFISSGLITLLYTSDIIVVKYLFSPEETGLYSGISTIAKIVFFVTGAVAGVLIPSISRHHTFNENNKVLMKAIVLNTIIGGLVLAVFILFPSRVIELMLGKKYLPYDTLLPYLSLMVFFVSSANMFVSFFIAMRNYILVSISLIGLCIGGIFLALYHSSTTEIITVYTATSIAYLVLLIAYYSYYAYTHYEKS